ncbi:class I SAM-dependent methyltransferase [Marinitenerispora sediminis]|uniref:class I SAM-dependent methyltransferase n=1 Tax=Marinitenerispora sediminis TaxID=1931232 RepID=UPI0021633F36|nr:class I SAM-dependent methyltransferase [Marinitenerispora sediminis]
MRLDLGWNHNAHYHPLLLRTVPDGCGRALDVGCGAGRFARALAPAVEGVDAIDVSADMIERARARTPARLGIHYTAASLQAFAPEQRRYGFISAIASLHHMPLTTTLRTLRAALAPGGVLAVVGLYRPESLSDLAATAAAAPPHWALGAGLAAARAVTRTPDPERTDGAAMPVRDPRASLREIGVVAARELPPPLLSCRTARAAAGSTMEA